MKMNLKRTIALLLCLLTVLPLFTACAFDENYTGPRLEVYMSDMPTTFDPAYAYLDESSMQIMSLMYEGLFSYDKNGKLTKALASDYRWVKKDEKKSQYILEITLRKTSWSDGQSVTADQVAFAWRRLLDPAMSSDAACLLYDIKNAAAAKTGDVSIYDIGVDAVDIRTLQLEFDHEINLDQFLSNLASPALVPLRDDVVEKNKMVDWDSTAAVVLSNGPFYLKTYTIGQMMRLERNRYYRRDVEEDPMDEYVTPYQIFINFSDEHVTKTDPLTGDTLDSIEFDSTYELNDYLWENGILDYYSNIPLEYREKYASSTTSKKLLSTASLYFNTENKLFSNPKVRKALSIAIDRTHLANNVVYYADPAEGLVPSGVFETNAGGSTFRDKGGSLIAPTGDLNGAKALLKEAGVSSGSFEITIKPTDPVAVATADYLIEVWGQLGFSVKVRTLTSADGNFQRKGYKIYTDDQAGYDGLIEDCYTDAYKAGDFDVILLDVCQMTNSAFSTLAPFSTNFCGSGIDLSQQVEVYEVHHVTGYESEEYDALIQAAFDEKSNTAERAEKLHAAEALLLEDAPVAPLFTYKTNYQIRKNITDVSFNWFGAAVFTKTGDKDYKYVEGEE